MTYASKKQSLWKADARVSKDKREFQLETFNGKTYEPNGRGLSEDMAELGRTIGKPWRLVLPEKAWPAKPSYRRGTVNHPCSVADGRKARMEATVMRYLAWAEKHGLKTVSVYPGSFGERNAVRFERRVVDVADFLGDAPVAELEE